MQYQKGQKRAAVTINGQVLSFENWGIYDGPYLEHRDQKLKVTDGKEGFIVDFTGDLPVYRAL